MKKFYFFLILQCIGAMGFGQSVFINEVHYDNVGSDVNEGFEIAAEAGTTLFGWRIILYNGSNGEAYASIVIPNMFPISNQSNGFGFLTVTHSGIQNGAPDGFALVAPSDSVVQFLSYEGVITATNGAATGLTSTDIGVSETSATPANESLQLTGYGNDYSDFTWQSSSTSSFGNANLGQTFGEGEAPETYDLTNFEILSNTEIHFTFSEKLILPLVGFNIITTSLTNVTESVMNDSVLILTFDPFTLGTSQNIEISKDLENINGELLSKNISETFLFNNSQPPLVISEIMYNNASDNTTQDKLEFIEFYNNSPNEIQLGGFSMSSGVDYNFPEGTTLAPHAFYIICEDSSKFEIAFAHSNTPEWSGSLSNTGEALTLINTEGVVLDSVYYKDSGNWPKEPDGEGPSLEIINPNYDNNNGSNWRPSDGFEGIYDNRAVFASPHSLRGIAVIPLNILAFEILNDSEIQLVFSTAIDSSSIDLHEISGLYSSLITTKIESDSILTITLDTPLKIGSEYNMNVSTSFVKDTNGLELMSAFSKSFFYNNSTPNLVITEIMYNLPGSDSGLEFIELYNNSDDSINISGFTFSHGFTHTFPVGTIVLPRGFVLLGSNGPKLTKLYGVEFTTWNSGSLLNSGEMIQILNANGSIIDDVFYYSNSEWPSKANGKGSSLEIINPDNDNNMSLNWRASEYHYADLNNQNIFASPGAIDINLNSVFYFTADSLSIYEGESSSVQVHLKNASKIGARVKLLISEHTATEHFDYVISTKNIQYNGLETIFTIDIKAHKDYIKEEEEYVEIKLDSPMHAVLNSTNNSIKIKIKDTDQGSANICINEINRHSNSTSPSGKDLPFIELANVDFYSENLARYTLKAESEDTTAYLLLTDFTSIRANNFTTIWIEDSFQFDDLRSVILSNNEIQLSLIKDNIMVNSASIPILLDTEVYARVFDCDGVFEKRSIATPNGSNNNVNIFENTSKNSLDIYPNPSKDYISFSKAGHYSIYNNIGVLVKTILNNNHINVTELPKGIYFVKSENGENGRFIKL